MPRDRHQSPPAAHASVAAGGAGLIVGNLELSKDGKAMRSYQVTDFDLHRTAAALSEAAQTLTTSDPAKGPVPTEDS